MYHRIAFELGQVAPRRDLQQRHVTVGILGEKFRRPAFALQNVDLDQLVRNPQLRKRKPRLVAVA